MKILLILNPKSGKGRGGKLLEKIKAHIELNKLDCEIFTTEHRSHATSIVKENAVNFDRIVIAGGDGTLNEAINGLDPDSDKQIGLLPIGSGNDFAKSLKLPAGINYNLELVFDKGSKAINTDLGRVSAYSDKGELIRTSLFTNSCGIGFDAYVAYLNQTNKLLSGLASYITAILKALWEHNSVNIDATFDDKPFEGEKLFVCIGNGETAGGGLYLTPGAIIDDGYLNYTVVERISRLKLLRYLPLAVINRLAGIKYAKMGKFRQAEIKLRKPFFVHHDGEIVTDSASIIKIESVNSKLKFIVS